MMLMVLQRRLRELKKIKNLQQLKVLQNMPLQINALTGYTKTGIVLMNLIL